MSLRVSFELNESDLKHFRLIMRAARKLASSRAPEEIVAGAEQLLGNIGTADAPEFVLERLQKLRLLIQMLSDIDWRLPHADAKRVLQALAYFTEPNDLIPDHVPGLGFLDDAIMIELVVRELRHEIEAYQDFRDFRAREDKALPRGQRQNRDKWLASRREELQSRMHRRRKKSGGGSTDGDPGLFR
tara:strand:- start:2501 stop:3061 length:561 start_codon:yes stop_codon:yes gene_type:complete